MILNQCFSLQIFFSSCSLSMESHCGIVARLLVVSFIAVCCSGESDTSTQLLFINYY